MPSARVSYRPFPVEPVDEPADQRPSHSLRQTFLKAGIITEATGSAYIELQSATGYATKVICAVFGPRQTKKTSTFSESGRLWCDYKYAPFATKSSRPQRSGQTDQERFLSRSMEKALHEAIRFETFPKAVLEVYILVLENDGSDFEAAVTCASAAIADAGVEMLDLVTAVSVGLSHDDCIVLDPRLGELGRMQATTSMSFIPSSQKITHVIMAGQTNESLAKRMIESCLDGCSQLSSVVRTILTS